MFEHTVCYWEFSLLLWSIKLFSGTPIETYRVSGWVFYWALAKFIADSFAILAGYVPALSLGTSAKPPTKTTISPTMRIAQIASIKLDFKSYVKGRPPSPLLSLTCFVYPWGFSFCGCCSERLRSCEEEWPTRHSMEASS